jgi:hypothetical protein
VGGVLLTTPERRLSLLLKRQELWEKGERDLSRALDAHINLPAIDLLDESDKLLSHRWVPLALGANTALYSTAAGHAGVDGFHLVQSPEGMGMRSSSTDAWRN